jgi:hypothetical protein
MTAMDSDLDSMSRHELIGDIHRHPVSRIS